MLICKRIFHKKLEIGSVQFELVTIFGLLENLGTHIKFNLARNVADFVLTCKRNIAEQDKNRISWVWLSDSITLI